MGFIQSCIGRHRALSAIRNNGVSAFQGEVYTGRIGPIVGTLDSVRIIKVSAFQGCPQGGLPLYMQAYVMSCCNIMLSLTIHTYIHTYMGSVKSGRIISSSSYQA